MKPIRLTMTAFGPYKERETVEFAKLHPHGIFVVSGATGAGKTTIFDAITFALYDAGSGADRAKMDMMRSDFADPTVATEVELIFEVKGRTYRIWRMFNDKGTKLEFFDITDGQQMPVVEKFQVRTVKAKVEELLGLTQQQFNQIVMLPQGEFQKLLTSDSKEKEEIFRKIFKTERFERMNELLKQKRDAAKEQAARAEMEKAQYVQHIRSKLPARDSALFETIAQPYINIHHLQEALLEEAAHYKEQATAREATYEQLTNQLEQQQRALAEQQVLNTRLVQYEERKAKLATFIEKRAFVEELQQQLEQALKAQQLEPKELRIQDVTWQLQQQSEQRAKWQRAAEEAAMQLDVATQQLDAAQQNEPKRKELEQHIVRLEAMRPVYEQLALKKHAVEVLEQALAVQQPKLTAATAKLEQQQAAAMQMAAAIEQLEDAAAAYTSVYEEQQRWQQIVQRVQQASVLQQQLQHEQPRIDALQQKAEQQQQQYDALEAVLRSNQAAYLAATLQLGEPCPVCQSTVAHIPHHAALEHVDEQQLNDLKEQAQAAQQQYYSERSKQEVGQQQLEAVVAELSAAGFTVAALSTYEQQLKELAADLQRLKEQQQQLTKLKQEQKQLDVQLQEATQTKQTIEQQLHEQQQQLAVEQALQQQAEQQIDARYATLQHVEQAIRAYEAEAQQLQHALERAQQQQEAAKEQQQQCTLHVTNCEQRIAELDKLYVEVNKQFEQALQEARFTNRAHYEQMKKPADEIETKQRQIANYYQQLHTVTAQVEEEQAELEGKELVDVVQLQQQLEQTNEAVKAAYHAWSEAKGCMQQCEQTREQLAKNAVEIAILEQQLQKVEQLYDVLRGQNRTKTSFERFVQLGYLEQVTYAANIRLKHLSNGQYFLKCTGRKQGNAQSGLSIDVFDSNTGQTRDVKTLSGGEKFNASLALALGMADVIQQSQGSVQIDTMFIDEGFGTLDSEALQKAIDVLIELQQSGRLIGVISHVEELKAQMPAILQVEKTKSGWSKTDIIIK